MQAHDGYAFLGANRDRVLPVVGAGVAGAAGAPSSARLAKALSDAVADAGHGEIDGDLYEVAEAAEAALGAAWVQQQVTRIVGSCELHPTDELRAMTLVPSRIVLTTNYDTAIELTAADGGMDVLTVLPADLGEVLQRGVPEGTLAVVHLHGHVGDPSSIVLTKSTYDAAFADPAIQVVVQQFAASKALVFVGHQLGANEAHLRRDIGRVTAALGGGTHLVFCPAGSIADAHATLLEEQTGVTVVPCPNDDGSYRYVKLVARRLAPAPVLAGRASLPRSPRALDAVDEPMFAAPASEVADSSARYVWRLGRYFGRAPTTTRDIAGRRVLLVGAPGAGKTHALRRAAQSDPDSAVYVHLPSVTARQPGDELAGLAVSWVARGFAERDGVPVPSRVDVEEGTWSFYLDSVDELPAGDRPGILRTIAELADTFPQHRWFVGSRWVPELEGALWGFDRFQLVESAAWSHAYAQRRGIDPAEFDAYVEGASDIEDVVAIPIFAASIVDRILDEAEPPTSALQLLLDLASRGLAEQEQGLKVDVALVDAWLDRLALSMVVAGRTQAPQGELIRDRIRGGIHPDVPTDWLATRVLLREVDGNVAFVAQPLHDARAARALSDHPDGEEILHRHTFASAGGFETLRPRWQYIVFLLLGHDYVRWAPVLAAHDPVLAARQLPKDAPRADADAALEVIWDWHEHNRVLLPRRFEQEVISDEDAFSRIADGQLAPPLLARVTGALLGAGWTDRANAIAALAAARHCALIGVEAPKLFADPHAVVRRRAAHAAESCNLTGEALALATASATETDSLARQTFAEAALGLATDADLAGVIAAIPDALLRHIGFALRSRIGRRGLLDMWSKAGGASDEILDDLAGADGPPWTTDDVRLLAQLWYPTEDGWGARHVREVLATHPAAALEGAFAADPSLRALVDLDFLMAELDPASLRAIAAGRPAHSKVVETRLANEEVRRSRPQQPPPPPTRPNPKDLLHDAVAANDLSTVGRLGAHHAGALTEAERAQLRPQVEVALRTPTHGQVPAQRITPTGDGRWAIADDDAWNMLQLGAELKADIDEPTWFDVAELGSFVHRDWLKATWKASYLPRLAARLPEASDFALTAYSQAVPGLDEPTARTAEPGLRSPDPETRARFAELIADADAVDVVAAVAATNPSAELDEVLAAAGDAAAEARMVDAFLAAGCPLTPGVERAWVERIASPTSEANVFAVVEHMLRAGVEAHEMMPWFRALSRTAGEGMIARVDALIADGTIPDASFLLYRKVEAALQVAPVPVDSLPDAIAELYGSTEDLAST